MLHVKRRLQLFTSIVTALIAVTSSTNSRAETESIDLKALAKKARPAVMLLVVSDAAGKEIATGTGFLVSSDGKLITNHHVIENAASTVAKAENGGMFVIEGVLADDPKNDLTLLKLKGNNLPFLSLSNNDKIEVGTRIAVIGSPLGLEGTMSEGIVSAVRDDERDVGLVQITAAISPGSSGSPVMKANGDVIGIASALIRGGQALNFAVPVEAVKALLAQPAKQVELKQTSNEAKVRNSPEYYAYLSADQKNAAAMVRSAQGLLKAFPNEALAHVCAGNAYTNAGLKKDALRSFQEAARLDPRSDAAEMGIGRCCLSDHDLPQSLEHFERAAKINPESSEAWTDIGIVHACMTNFTGAATALQMAVRLSPDNEVGWEWLGNVRVKSGEYDGAKAAFLMFYKLKPKQAQDVVDDYESGLRKAALVGLREIVLARREKLDEEVNRNRATADRQTGQDSMSRQNRQMSRMFETLKAADDSALKGEYAKAVLAYQEILRDDPITGNAGVHAVIGRCYAVLGEHADAIKAFRLANAEDPKNCYTSVALSGSLFATEQFAEAREVIDSVSHVEGTPCELAADAMKLAIPKLEAASEIRRKILQESTGSAVQNSGSDKK